MTRWWQDPEDDDWRYERLWEEAHEVLAEAGVTDPTDAQIEATVTQLRESEDEAAAEARAERQQEALEARWEADWDRYVDSL